jgi:hypothetical protein
MSDKSLQNAMFKDSEGALRAMNARLPKSDPKAEALLNSRLAGLDSQQKKALQKRVYETKMRSGGKLSTEVVRRAYDSFLTEHLHKEVFGRPVRPKKVNSRSDVPRTPHEMRDYMGLKVDRRQEEFEAFERSRKELPKELQETFRSAVYFEKESTGMHVSPDRIDAIAGEIRDPDTRDPWLTNIEVFRFHPEFFRPKKWVRASDSKDGSLPGRPTSPPKSFHDAFHMLFPELPFKVSEKLQEVASGIDNEFEFGLGEFKHGLLDLAKGKLDVWKPYDFRYGRSQEDLLHNSAELVRMGKLHAQYHREDPGTFATGHVLSGIVSGPVGLTALGTGLVEDLVAGDINAVNDRLTGALNGFLDSLNIVEPGQTPAEFLEKFGNVAMMFAPGGKDFMGRGLPKTPLASFAGALDEAAKIGNSRSHGLKTGVRWDDIKPAANEVDIPDVGRVQVEKSVPRPAPPDVINSSPPPKKGPSGGRFDHRKSTGAESAPVFSERPHAAGPTPEVKRSEGRGAVPDLEARRSLVDHGKRPPSELWPDHRATDEPRPSKGGRKSETSDPAIRDGQGRTYRVEVTEGRVSRGADPKKNIRIEPTPDDVRLNRRNSPPPRQSMRPQTAQLRDLRLDVAKSLVEEAARRAGKNASTLVRARALRAVRREFDEIVSLPHGEGRRASVANSDSPMGAAVRGHDQVEAQIRSDVEQMRRQAGLPVVRGMDRASLARHVGLRDVRLSVDGRHHGTYRNWVEAQRAAKGILRESPHAVLRADAVDVRRSLKRRSGAFDPGNPKYPVVESRQITIGHETIAGDVRGSNYDPNTLRSDAQAHDPSHGLEPAPEAEYATHLASPEHQPKFWNLKESLPVGSFAWAIRKFNKEVLGIFHNNVLVFAPRVGEDFSVSNLSLRELLALSDSTIVHNHPAGGYFSAEDFRLFAHHRVRKLYAVQPDGTAWMIQRNESRTDFDSDKFIYYMEEAGRRAEKKAGKGIGSPTTQIHFHIFLLEYILKHKLSVTITKVDAPSIAS